MRTISPQIMRRYNSAERLWTVCGAAAHRMAMPCLQLPDGAARTRGMRCGCRGQTVNLVTRGLIARLQRAAHSIMESPRRRGNQGQLALVLFIAQHGFVGDPGRHYFREGTDARQHTLRLTAWACRKGSAWRRRSRRRNVRAI